MMPRDIREGEPLARDPVEELAEAFLERFRRGERPSLSEFIALAPEHAEEIRELFPALVLMEQADPVGTVKSQPVCRLERLGDYRLLREVGRGGMGIVFEAEQEALGRHVALKILSYSIASDSRCLERFRREARSAARLHHTNIVPVYDIGEREGIHYYAMQFIQGQGLDEVIVELQRLRRLRTPRTSDLATDRTALGPITDLAEGLLTGGIRGESSAATQEPSSMHGRKPSVLSDWSDFSTKSDFQFYRSVARIGLQVAEALAYAHSQRVLHRDIKPSNLLLDAGGSVWVTDFGLAKEEGDDLTRPGDVVGTLRYMAPERLSGVSEPRSDIYGLGLTLYELLTFRPAFAETDRAQLVEKITRHEPTAPRKFDPQIPRDLETIVLKAIAKEPARRYATAAEMAEDLRRFQMDRPIRARRTSQWEHVWRWCRRNPGWAATLALAVGLLLVVAVGGSVMNLHLNQALGDVQIAVNDKTDQLWQAHLERARALRSSGRVGQRYQALSAIQEAAKIKMTPELRDEAVAALALPDIELVQVWDGFPEGTIGIAHDATFHRYARMDRRGEITLCRLSTDGEEVIRRLPIHGQPAFPSMWMSPDGRFLAYSHSAQKGGVAGAVRIWDLGGPEPTVRWDEPLGVHEHAISFHPNSRRLAIGHADGTISIHDLTASGSPRRLTIGQAANSLAFHPVDSLLALAGRGAIRLFDVDTGKESPAMRDAKVPMWGYGLAWHPDGRLLAATSEDKKIHLWDTRTATAAMTPLAGHASSGIVMAFNRQGDRLLSAGWDRQTRLWDTVTGRLLLTMPDCHGTQFSPDGKLIGLGRDGTKLQLWRLADGRELRYLRRPAADPPEEIHHPVLDGSGRILAASSRKGFGFYELATGRELASVWADVATTVHPRTFDSVRGWMTSGSSGALLWPIRHDPTRPHVRHIGPPQALAATGYSGSDATSDGRVYVIPQGNQTLVLDRIHPAKRVSLRPQFDVRNCTVSPDGRWVAACSWWPDGISKNVRIWDAHTARQVVDLPIESSAHGRFSPDGRWLAVNTSEQGCQLWEVDGWRAGMRFSSGAFCWTPRDRHFAVGDASGVLRFIDLETSREILKLMGPEASQYTPSCFTPDGATLIAATSDYTAIHVWDLRLIRTQLRELGMDWDLPEFPPAPPPHGARPLEVEIDPGFLRTPIFTKDRDTVTVFSLLLALQPINPEAYLQRALAHGRLNEPRNAIRDYELFLALAPISDRRWPEVQYRRAYNYMALNEVPRALASLAETMGVPSEQIPWPQQYARLCNDVAWECVKYRQDAPLPDAVLLLAEKATEWEPGNILSQNTLGVTLYRLGRHEDAIGCLEKNVLYSQKFAAFDLYFLAMCHARLGQTTKARSYFDRANDAAKTAGFSAEQVAELTAFRIEAEELFHIAKKK